MSDNKNIVTTQPLRGASYYVTLRDGGCELTQMSLLGSSTQPINLARITAARVATATTTDSRGKKSTNYQILLQTTSGDVLITHRGDAAESQQWAGQINAFLTNTAQRTFTYNDDSRWLSYSVSAMILGFGIWMAILALRVTTYDFDRTAGTLTIEQHLVGTWTKAYPLADIRDLEVRLQENRRRDRADSRRLYFELSSDRSIATNLPDENNLIALIRTFLGARRLPG